MNTSMDDKNTEKGADKGEEELKERINKLEKRIEEFEKGKEKKHEPSIANGIIHQVIPGLSGIVKALENASPEFRRKIAETDAEIQHKLETGWSGKPVVSYSISTRPLSSQRTTGRSRRGVAESEAFTEKTLKKEPIFDIFDEKDCIAVIAELPGVEEKDLEVALSNRTLEISAGKYSKTITLPAACKSIIKKTFKHGILRIKIEREENAS